MIITCKNFMKSCIERINKSNKQLKSLTIHCSHLEKENQKKFCNCSYLQSETVQSLCYKGSTLILHLIPNLSSLREISIELTKNVVSFDSIVSLINKENITSFSFSYVGTKSYEISIESLKKINEFVNLKLLKLEMFKVTIEDETNDFKFQLPKLESLSIKYISINNDGDNIDISSLPFMLFKGLKYMNKLRQLIIKRCQLRTIHLEYLVNKIKYLPLLESIEIITDLGNQILDYSLIEEECDNLMNVREVKLD